MKYRECRRLGPVAEMRVSATSTISKGSIYNKFIHYFVVMQNVKARAGMDAHVVGAIVTRRYQDGVIGFIHM
jgi:hypothetical protein